MMSNGTPASLYAFQLDKCTQLIFVKVLCINAWGMYIQIRGFPPSGIPFSRSDWPSLFASLTQSHQLNTLRAVGLTADGYTTQFWQLLSYNA